MKKRLLCLLVAIALVVSLPVLAYADTEQPSPTVSAEPAPTAEPTVEPTAEPSPSASAEPSPSASAEPSAEPSQSASAEPSAEPSPSPSASPSAKPSPSASASPSPTPTEPSSSVQAIVDCDDYIITTANGGIVGYTATDPIVYLKTDGDYVIAMKGGVTTALKPIVCEDGIVANVTFNNLTIDVASGSAFDVGQGTINLTLIDTNTLSTGAAEKAAVHLPAAGSLTIGEPARGGSLTVTGGISGGAGIGGSSEQPMGTLIINSGTINATGGVANVFGGGAGIGGAGTKTGSYTSAGTVTINGGSVTAEGGAGSAANNLPGGAGIGAGGGEQIGNTGCTITINGGSVTATGRDLSAGIGGGGNACKGTDRNGGNGGYVTINGGTIKAVGGANAAGIGGGGIREDNTTGGSGATVVITGGTIKTDGYIGGSDNGGSIGGGKGARVGFIGSIKNSDGDVLYLTTLKLDGALANTAVTRIEGAPSYYGLTGVKTQDADTLYCYFPVTAAGESGAVIVTAGDDYYNPDGVKTVEGTTGNQGTLNTISSNDVAAFQMVEGDAWWYSGNVDHAVASVYSGGTVYVLKDCTWSGGGANAAIQINKPLTLTSLGSTKTITRAASVSPDWYSLIKVANLPASTTKSIYINNIVLSGGGNTNLMRVLEIDDAKAKVELGSGAVIKNASDSGRGVEVVSGNLKINGGEIKNCAGGLYIAGGASADFTSGSINNNTRHSGGGGVYIANDGVFTMSGSAEITGNSGTTGGGVYLSGGSFTMTGGEISSNSASAQGGGVIASSPTLFSVNGGTITDNTAVDYGGGVYLTGGTFSFISGEISDNTVTSVASDSGQGGGVYLINGATLNMSGGEIKGNSTPTTGQGNFGGGVYMTSGTTSFNMSAGKIKENSAIGGSGVHVYNGTFNMSGGEITANNADSVSGGAVRTDNGILNASGGVRITGNTYNNSAAENVVLSDYQVIDVSASLASNAQIGVSVVAQPSPGNTTPVGSGVGTPPYSITADDAAKFSSDDANYQVRYDSANNLVALGIAQKVDQNPLLINGWNASASVGDTFDVTVAGGSTNGAISFENTNCRATLKTVNIYTVQITAAGAYSLKAKMAGNDDYNDVYSELKTGTAAKTDQNPLLINGWNASASAGNTFDITVTGGSTGGAISFENTNCRVTNRSGNTYTVQITAAGAYSLKAKMAGDAAYNDVFSAQMNGDAAKRNQSALTISGWKTSATAGDVFDITVAGGSTGGALSFENTNCRVTNKSGSTYTVQITAGGAYSLRSKMAGDSVYNDIYSELLSGTAAKAEQAALAISGWKPSAKAGDVFDITVSGGSTGGAISFENTNCRVTNKSGNTYTVQIIADGAYSLRAKMAGDSVYNDVYSELLSGNTAGGGEEGAADLDSVSGITAGQTYKGGKFSFGANGVGMDNTNPKWGDEKHVPVSWSVNPSGTWTKAPYTANFTLTTPGKHTLTVTFDRYIWNGSDWAYTNQQVQKSVEFYISADGSGISGTSEPVSPKTGDNALPMVGIIVLIAAAGVAVALIIYRRAKTNGRASRRRG